MVCKVYGTTSKLLGRMCLLSCSDNFSYTLCFCLQMQFSRAIAIGQIKYCLKK